MYGRTGTHTLSNKHYQKREGTHTQTRAYVSLCAFWKILFWRALNFNCLLLCQNKTMCQSNVSCNKGFFRTILVFFLKDGLHFISSRFFIFLTLISSRRKFENSKIKYLTLAGCRLIKRRRRKVFPNTRAPEIYLVFFVICLNTYCILLIPRYNLT